MALRMTCGDLTVSVLTPGDVPELLDLAVRGVVPESATVYPFLTDWAKLPASGLRANSTAWYFSAFASWTNGEWPVDYMGDLAHSLRFRLTEDRLVRPTDPLVVEGVDAVRTFVGL